MILSSTTAYQLLRRAARVGRGQRVLVLGAAGQAQLVLGRLAGLEMWGTARGEHAVLVRELGATPIGYQRQDFTRILPGGYDVIFDGVGEDGYRRSFAALKHRRMRPNLPPPLGISLMRPMQMLVETFRGAIRKGDWKLVKVALLPGKVELFNLAKDPAEKDNVAEQNPDIVRDLEARLLGYAKEQVPSEWIKAQPAFVGGPRAHDLRPRFRYRRCWRAARKAVATQRGWSSPKMRRLRARLKRNAGGTRALRCSIPEAGGEQTFATIRGDWQPLVHHPIALRAHTSFHGAALGILIEIGRHSPCAALHVNEALSRRCARG